MRSWVPPSKQRFWQVCTFYGNLALVVFGLIFPNLTADTRRALISTGVMNLFMIIRAHGGFGDIGGDNAQANSGQPNQSYIRPKNNS